MCFGVIDHAALTFVQPARGLEQETFAQMKCEIEFLAVGEASKAGDAIAICYGEPTAYNVMVVDCGMAKTGIDMAAHLKKYLGQSVWIDHAVLTHPDIDHASGFRELLSRVTVKKLWLIPPWSFAQ
jgi:glyoxylase-like metal-dependent hydrolase (beta-lactamase superfamily II)